MGMLAAAAVSAATPFVSILDTLAPAYDFDAERDTMYNDSGSTVAGDGDTVDHFTDGTGTYLATAYPTRLATRRANYRNGRAVLDFATANSVYSLGDVFNLGATEDRTWIVVMDPQTSSGRVIQKGGRGSWGSQERWLMDVDWRNNGGTLEYTWEDIYTTTGVETSNGVHKANDYGSWKTYPYSDAWGVWWMEWDHNTGRLTLYNHDQADTGPMEVRGGDPIGGSITTTRPMTIGANMDAYGSNLSQWFRGYVGRIIIFDRLLTPTERTQVLDELTTDWGLNPTV